MTRIARPRYISMSLPWHCLLQNYQLWPQQTPSFKPGSYTTNISSTWPLHTCYTTSWIWETWHTSTVIFVHTQTKLKVFNAKRKFRAAIQTYQACQKIHSLSSSLSEEKKAVRHQGEGQGEGENDEGPAATKAASPPTLAVDFTLATSTNTPRLEEKQDLSSQTLTPHSSQQDAANPMLNKGVTSSFAGGTEEPPTPVTDQTSTAVASQSSEARWSVSQETGGANISMVSTKPCRRLTFQEVMIYVKWYAYKSVGKVRNYFCIILHCLTLGRSAHGE